jgi:hypothetical protein
MKLCIECRYMNPGSGPRFERCDAPQNIASTDPVDGSKSVHWHFCESLRTGGPIFSRLSHRCGRGARWFAPKETVLDESDPRQLNLLDKEH